MQVSTNSTLAKALFQGAKSQSFTTLLQLVKPLSSTQALVKLLSEVATMDQITLSIKQPLEPNTLYKVLIEKQNDTFVLKTLFPLQEQTKSLLKQPSHLSLEQFIAGLKKGKSPQAILFESLSHTMLQSTDKDTVAKQLDQLLTLMKNDTPTIFLEHEKQKGYITFEKPKHKSSNSMIKFTAFFLRLGELQGTLETNSYQTRVHLYVQTKEIQTKLLKHKKTLGFALKIDIQQVPKVVESIPAASRLDIKG